MSAQIIDGRKLSDIVVAYAIAAAADLKRPPGLGVIIVGDDPASHLYVRGKLKRAQEANFLTEVIALPADASEAAVLHAVEALNTRDDIDGVLVQLPLPEHVNTLRVRAAVART